MKSLGKGVKPNKAPVSQIRMRVRESFGPPGTERFSNVPQRAATRAMHIEMFFEIVTRASGAEENAHQIARIHPS
jgi:hypothetical protein